MHLLVGVVILLVALCVVFALWLRNTPSSSDNIGEDNPVSNLQGNLQGNLQNEQVLHNELVLPNLNKGTLIRVDDSGNTKEHQVDTIVKVEEPKEVVFELKFISSLVFPCVVRDLNIKNCISAEVVRAVVPRTDYTIKSAWLDVKAVGQPAFVRTTIPDGIYDILELLTALTHAVSTSGYSGSAVSTSLLYLERTSKVIIANAAMEDFVMSMSDRLAYMLGMESPSVASVSAQVVGTRRVDLSGARSVFITTTQFSEHKENILQEVPLDFGVSVWENKHLDETERIFTPRNILALNLDVMVKYPNFVSIATPFDANGVAIDITIRFKCLRYAASTFVDTELELC